MLVVYVGTHDEVEINGGPVAVRGEPVEAADEIAGQAPQGERWTEDYDPGFGLLAQTDNWALPGSDAAKAARTVKVVVGEKGPELLNLPAGTTVSTAKPTPPPVTPPVDGNTEGKSE